MALLSVPFVFTVGAVIVAGQHNSNFSNIYQDYSGNIQDVNIAANAGIEYSKLSLNASILYSDLANSTKTSIQNNLGVPSGVILMWSGTIATIPSGWNLCNGANSTPDLRNLFIVGADADVTGTAMSTVTGSALQTSITGVMPAHTHNVIGGNTGNTPGGPTLFDATNSAGTPQATTSTGTGTKVISVFFALAYIQKA